MSDSDSDSDWNEELLNAVRKKEGKSQPISEEDRIKRAQECLNEGADIDTVDKHNNTALHLAVKKRYIKVIKFLLNRGAKTNILNGNNQTAVNLAEAPGKEDLLRAIKGSVDPGTQRASTSRDGVSVLVKDPGQSSKRNNTADDNEQDRNGKRRRLDTEEEGREVIPQQTSHFGDDRHAAAGLKQTQHGNMYQLKLLMLFLYRGLEKGYDFRLATEMAAAEKFDDLVFQYVNETGDGTVYRFLQAKHKQDESKKIGSRDLLTEEDDDFSLQKYFISYRRMKKHPELSKSAFEDFVLCTNINFDFEKLKAAKIRLKEVNERDDILDITTSTKETARYKFIHDKESDLHRILKRTADPYVLAKTLVEHAYGSKEITLRNDIFKLYRTALIEKVIDVKNRQFSDNFIKGKSLSPRELNFREIFCDEALRQKKFSKDTSDDVLWEKIKKNPLNISSNFGQQFKLSTDPTVTPLKEFSEELVKLIKNADTNGLIEVNGQKYRKNARKGSNARIFADNINKLAGHVLIIKDKKIKFRSQFFDDNIKPPGNLEALRNSLKYQLGSTLYHDLGRYQFKMSDNFKTCEEEELDSKTELPGDSVDDNDIVEFYEKLIFAVNQPNETELGDAITREIATEFNLLNADLIGDSFQKWMMDWFKEKGKEKGKEGRFLSAEDGRVFFDSAKQNVDTLVSSGLSLTYPKELKKYGIEFEVENEELRNFLTPDSGDEARLALNLVATGETLPTVIRVHRAICQTGKYTAEDSLLFLSLPTLLLPDVGERVIRAFESRQSHHLLVIDCKSVGKHPSQELYNRLFEIMKKIGGKKLILVTLVDEPLGPKVRLKNCEEADSIVGFNDLTTESRYKLMSELMINFQGQRAGVNFAELLGIRSCDDMVTEELTNLGNLIDTSTLVKLIRGEEIAVGNELQTLGEIENYYINRKFNQQVVIKDDILRSKSTSDLFVFSGVNRAALTSLITYGREVRYFDDINRSRLDLNDFIILDTEREAEQFEELCKNTSVNVHWLKRVCGKFIWKKSRGSIATLISHSDVSASRSGIDNEVTKSADNYLTEDQLTDYNEGQNIVIISNSAGMGKTTVFTYLARKIKQKKPHLWVVRIDLNDFTDVLQEELKNRSSVERNTHEVVEFFVEKFSNLKTDLQKNILKIMIKSRDRVALMFDGFDEISPEYKKPVIDLLETFQKIGIAKLFVATRPHMREALEKKLGLFSYTIEPFSELDQIDFLVRYWKAGLGLSSVEERFEKRLSTYAKALTKKIVSSIDDRMKEFAGIPLQTRMMAEIFQDKREGNVVKGDLEVCEEFLSSVNDEPKLPDKIRLVDLYRSFVDKKHHISCTEKNKCDPTNLGVKKDSKDLREIFLKRHQKLAVYTLFNAESFPNFSERSILTVLLNQEEIDSTNKDISEIIRGNERTGIINQVINGRVQFIHRTFVEYFSATFLINILKQDDHNEALRQFIVEDIFLSPKYKIIRAFLDGLLLEVFSSSSSGNQYSFSMSAAESWKSSLRKAQIESGKTVFHQAVRDGNYQILRFLVNRFDKHDKIRMDLLNAQELVSRETLLHLTADQQHWDELIWLVENGADVNVKSRIHDTVLHIAAKQEKWVIFKWLVKERGADVNDKGRHNVTVLQEAARKRQWDLVKWLVVDEGADVNIREENGKTLVHHAASFGQFDLMKLLVDKRGDISLKTNTGMTVLHCAAASGVLPLVEWLVEEKGFKDINLKIDTGETVLHLAAAKDHWDMVKWLVKEKGANVQIENNEGFTVLHSAASSEKWDLLRLLASPDDVNVNTEARGGHTPLRYAVRAAHLDTIKWLIEEKGIDVNSKFRNEKRILHYAVSRWNVEVIKWLVDDKGADITAADKNGETILHDAVTSRNVEVIKWLVDDKGADITAADKNGKTILDYAVSRWNVEVIKWLVDDKRADITAADKNGKTILHYAVSRGNFEDIKWLVDDKGADITAADENGKTILHYAVSRGNFEDIKWLVDDKGADITAADKNGETILHYAVSRWNVEVIEWLVDDKGVDITAADKNGKTILHDAATSRNFEDIKWLVDDKGADITAADKNGKTILHYAVSWGKFKVIKWLVDDKGVDITAADKNGKTILHYAVRRWDVKIIKWLVDDKGADITAADENGKTILHYAVTSSDVEVIKWLVHDKGADITAADKNGKTILHYAVIRWNVEVIKWLVDDKGVDITAADKNGKTILHYAVTSRNVEVIKWLVDDKGADITAADENGKTILHYAVSRGDFEDMKWLVDDKGADITAADIWLRNVDMTEADKNGKTILHYAFSRWKSEVIDWLVCDKRVDITAVDKNGKTILHDAVTSRNFEDIKWLMDDKGADITAAAENGKTILDYTVSRWNVEVIKWLVDDKGADITAVDKNGKTILHYAVTSSNVEVIKWLVDDKGADITAADKNGKTILHYAVSRGNFEDIKWLVDDKGADITAADENGKTILHYAVSRWSVEAIKWLVDDKGADITAADKNGKTILHDAVTSRNVEVIKWLVDDKGADITAADEDGKTILDYAVSRWNAEVIKWLVDDKGADITAADKNGKTILHYAVSRGKFKVIKWLVDDKGADITAADKNGKTILHYAVSRGKFKVIKWLVDDKGADITAADENGKTILHYTVNAGNVEFIKWLVDDKGADITAVDENGKTVLHYAAAGGRYEIFEWLLDNKAVDIKAKDNDGRTVLHEAAIAANIDMIRLLVKFYQVDITATDNHSDTALDLYCRNSWRRDEEIVQLLEQGDCNLESALMRKKRSHCLPRRKSQPKGLRIRDGR